VQPAVGSTFSASDEQLGAPRAAVISDALWSKFLNRDPSVLQKTITLNGQTFSVVGVAPRGFSGLLRGIKTDVWVTLPQMAVMSNNPELMTSPNISWMNLAGRLRPGTSIQQAQAQLTSVLPGVSEEAKKSGKWGVALTESAGGNNVYVAELARPLTLLFFAVVLILAIACANVANLLLARAKSRGKEIGIRLALGASRRRIVFQLLTESMLLSVAGGALGLLMAFWTSALTANLRTRAAGEVALDVSPNARILLFTLAASVFTVLLFGVLPALRASRVDLVPVLKDGTSGTPVFRRGPSLHSLMVVTQVTLSLILLAAGGLFLRSLWKLQAIEKGFTGENVLAMSLNMGLQGYDAKRGAQFYTAALDRLSSAPGVQSVTLASALPVSIGGSRMDLAPNSTKPALDTKVAIEIITTGPRFFETTGLPLLKGREFRNIDAEKSTKVIVVNETMAKKFWPDRDPLGQNFNDGATTYEVVGVARDTKYRNLREAPRNTMYQPLAQSYRSSMTLLVRSAGDPASVVPAIQNELRALEPALTIFNVRTLLEHVGRSLYVERMETIIFGLLGLLALVLTAIGVYGVVAYSVAQRTRELGIRMALGAQKMDVLRLILVKGLVLVAWGAGIGLMASYWLSRLIANQLYGVSPSDPVTLISVAVLLAAVALLASYIPARRATKVDPLVALRYE